MDTQNNLLSDVICWRGLLTESFTHS